MEERAELECRQGIVAVENPVVCRLNCQREGAMLDRAGLENFAGLARIVR